MKVGFGIAHYPEAPGACHGWFCEHAESAAWTQGVVDALRGFSTIDSFVAPIGRLPSKVAAINAENCDLALEIHFNAGPPGASASGCETLYYPSSIKGERAARIMQPLLCSAMQNRDRGVKEGWHLMDRPGIVDWYGDEDGDEIPNYFLRATRCPALILEPEFVNQYGHILNSRARAVSTIAHAICTILIE